MYGNIENTFNMPVNLNCFVVLYEIRFKIRKYTVGDENFGKILTHPQEGT